MFNAANLPDTIPVFPLPGALLLPRARLPLHIFEPRYLAMLDDVLKTQHRLIGMIQPLPGSDPPALHNIGCAGRVSSFSETDDGRYMLSLSGISRFTITKTNEGFTPYIRCDVSWDGFERDLQAGEQDPDFERARFMEKLRQYFSTLDLETDWETLQGANDEMLINSLSMLCPLDPEDKQALLEAETLPERRAILATLLEFARRSGQNDEVMQ